jgi:hypothetical protein
LIFLFLIYQVIEGNLSEVIEHSPTILGPGIVLAFYFLTLELTRNEKVALIAALFGAVSLHTLIGIYAGFYANWLALIVGYISIAFLFRYLRSGHYYNIVAFLALAVASMFFHVYTWAVLSVVEGIFLIAMLLTQSNKNNKGHLNKKRIIWLLLVVMLSIVIDIGRASLTDSSVGLRQDIEIAPRTLGLEQFNLRWQILNMTMYETLGGVFSNFIILILALVWVLKSNLVEPSNVFLMIFLSVGLVPLFFGSWAVQARVFYDMPFEIPAAIALYYISKKSGSMLMLLAGCTWLIAVSLFTVMNYYLILVPGAK